MYCPRCGSQIADNSSYCIRCGVPISTTDASLGAPGAAPVPPGEQQTEPKAVASLIFGILGVTIFSIFAGIPAVILGHIAHSKIGKSMGRLKGQGMAIAGLVMGYLSVVAIPFILIIAAIAIPNLLRSRIAANEASAVGSLRTINTAIVYYESEYPKVGCPAVLNHLGGETAESDTQAGLIDAELAEGMKSGYVYHYESFDSDGDRVRDRYFVRADPYTANSGKRSFCTDESGVIRFEVETQCTAESPPLQ